MKPFLDRDDNIAGRFARAIQRGLTRCRTHDPSEAPGVTATYFSTLSPGNVVFASARSLKARGLWHESVAVTEAPMMAWQGLIAEGQYITAPIPYADAIDTRPVTWAIASLAQEAAAARA